MDFAPDIWNRIPAGRHRENIPNKLVSFLENREGKKPTKYRRMDSGVWLSHMRLIRYAIWSVYFLKNTAVDSELT